MIPYCRVGVYLLGREFELKYRADDAVIDAIREKYGDFRQIRMETTYYGTAGGELSRRKWTLRRRMENDVSVCTLKTPGGAHARNEYEVACGDIHTAIGLLCDIGAPQELKTLTDAGVVPVCGAKFIRLARTLRLEGLTVELALDRGFLTGGGKRMPLAEVEVELKEGSEEAAAAFAEALAEEFALLPEPRSKFARALYLANLP